MHRHHLEELVALRTAELEAARTAAESANASKSAFLANMSHEIRTPMNAVIGLTHLALQTELTDQQRNYLEKARTASENLLGIINDILDFSKIEAGKLQMGAEAFQLEEVLERTLRLAGARTGERRLETRLELAPEVPTALVGDPLRLGQVLTNLLSNALKFTESGEVVLSVRRLRPLDGRVVLQFSVRDTGIGIAPEQLQRLFLPFSQADGSITRTYGGTGLGLAICRHLVHLMEGEIRVASEPGQGSEFVFTAVFGLGSAVAAGTQPARRPGPSPEQLRRLQGAQVLLVEDNEFNQLVATDLLGILGVRATLARNGQEALELIRGQRFQAVLMDLQMPVLDGYETTLRIRADPALAGLPIVAMTAHAMVRERERCRALGMDDYLTKPINPELLAGTLARWIGGDRPGTGAAGWTPEPEAPAGEPAPVISWAAGAGNFQGHPALYEKTLLKFLDLQRTRPGHIQALLDQGELESAGREAHSMIAGAGMIGAGRLALSARELQDALGAGPAGRVAPALARYEADLALVLEQLEARFDKA
jgi:CheY-like chemotaxis protein/two-component sensor histidine kinase